MRKILEGLLLVTILLACLKQSHGQYVVVIPPNSNVITSDTVIDCSFIPTHRFLVCPGASLTLTGNSTCANHFYMENASVVTFNDTFPNIPYGIFSFFIRGIAILDYNDNTPVSFHQIDTLIYEPSALLIDTGSIFHYIQSFPSVIFDYSLFPVSNPCASTSTGSEIGNAGFSVSPLPFSKALNFQSPAVQGNCTILVSNMLGEELERFEITSPGSQTLNMKNDWIGMAILKVIKDGAMGRGKLIIRLK